MSDTENYLSAGELMSLLETMQTELEEKDSQIKKLKSEKERARKENALITAELSETRRNLYTRSSREENLSRKISGMEWDIESMRRYRKHAEDEADKCRLARDKSEKALSGWKTSNLILAACVGVLLIAQSCLPGQFAEDMQSALTALSTLTAQFVERIVYMFAGICGLENPALRIIFILLAMLMLCVLAVLIVYLLAPVCRCYICDILLEKPWYFAAGPIVATTVACTDVIIHALLPINGVLVGMVAYVLIVTNKWKREAGRS